MTTTILNPTYDTDMNSNAATSNFDTATILNSGESDSVANQVRRILLKFDFSSIPSSAVVVSATLELYAIQDRTSNTRIKRWYRVKRNVVSDQTTWNIFSTGNSWQTAGCDGANDRESTDIGSLSFNVIPTLNQYYSWTLTASAIEEMINGVWTTPWLILITETENGDQVGFESLENAGGNDPKLTIVWTPGTIATYRTRRGINLLGRHERRLVF